MTTEKQKSMSKLPSIKNKTRTILIKHWCIGLHIMWLLKRVFIVYRNGINWYCRRFVLYCRCSVGRVCQLLIKLPGRRLSQHRPCCRRLDIDQVYRSVALCTSASLRHETTLDGLLFHCSLSSVCHCCWERYGETASQLNRRSAVEMSTWLVSSSIVTIVTLGTTKWTASI